MVTVGYGKKKLYFLFLSISMFYIMYIFNIYVYQNNLGDISPTTYTEKVLSIVITIVSCGVFAFAVNTIDIIVR